MKEENLFFFSKINNKELTRSNSISLLETKEVTPFKKLPRNPDHFIEESKSFMLKPNSDSFSKFIMKSSRRDRVKAQDKSLPKISNQTLDNYEQISGNPPVLSYQRNNSNKRICSKKPDINLPIITTKEYFLDQLMKLVYPKNKADVNYITIKNCMNKAVKYTPRVYILHEEEKRRIELGNSFNYIKTSLTKRINNSNCHRSNSNCLIKLAQMKSNALNSQDQTYSKFIMNEKDNERKEIMKKLQSIRSSYAKQRYNHRGNTTISKLIPLHQLKKRNQECVIENQQDKKKKIEDKVSDISAQIHNISENILNVLDHNLFDFKNELDKEYNNKSEM